MPATKKTTKMIRKNPVTGSTYTISKRTDVNPKSGKIKGLWKKATKATSASKILIKCGSHRTREKVFQLVGHKHQLCSFSRNVAHGIFEVTIAEYEKIKSAKIKGISKTKNGDDLFPCWNGKE